MRLGQCASALIVVLAVPSLCLADGILVEPRYEAAEYTGSLQERSQEAIIVYRDGVEDLIIKVSYDGEPSAFAWVVPFPEKPKIEYAEADLFAELFGYVDYRLWEQSKPDGGGCLLAHMKKGQEGGPRVRVLETNTVGNYDISVVEETAPGGLNGWLEQNGFQTLPEEVVTFYSGKGWVYAAIKVNEAAGTGERVLHPLHFRFRPDREDAMVYPMKISGTQSAPMDVNLYVFSSSWINVDTDENGTLASGFDARYKEPDSHDWSKSDNEPEATQLVRVRQFFLKHHAGESFYLTNIHQERLDPAALRGWADDLYITSDYYTFASWLEDWGGYVLAAAVVAGVVVGYVVWRLRRWRRERIGAAASGAR
jgi:hypothetical protein